MPRRNTRVQRILFLVAFGVAIWALSAGWGTLRATWAAPTWSGAAATTVYLAIFAAAFLYLGFTLYLGERSAGKVRRPIGLYERILANRERGTGNGNTHRDERDR